MAPSCLAVVALFSTLSLSMFNWPTFSYEYSSAHAHNLSCTEVFLNTTHSSVNASKWYMNSAPTGRVACSSQLDWHTYKGVAYFEIEVDAANLILPTVMDCNDCTTMMIDTDHKHCEVKTRVTSFHVVPPNGMVEIMIQQFRSFISSRINNEICGNGEPSLEEALLNHTDAAWFAVPDLLPGALPLASSPLFRSINHIIGVLPQEVGGLHISSSWVGQSTMRLTAHVVEPLPVMIYSDTEDDLMTLVGPPSWLPRALQPLYQHVQQELMAPFVAGNLSNWAIEGHIPADASLSMDVSFKNLSCDAFSYACAVDLVGGIAISNLRVDGAGDVGRLLTLHAVPAIQNRSNELLQELLNTSDDATRYTIPTAERAVVNSRPCIPMLALLAVFVLSAGAYATWRNIKRQATAEAVRVAGAATEDEDDDDDAQPVSVKRILVEDALLTLGVLVCGLGFCWSNTTTGSTVVVGGEMELYAFSLKHTVSDLWQSGLKPLSVCVLLFSGVYPYIKLLSLLYFTLIRQDPRNPVLEFVDYFGKFSFIDSFVMMVMVAGLEARGIADVRMDPSFFIFLGSTIGSIVMGNYAMYGWRRGTSLAPPHHSAPSIPTTTEEHNEVAEGHAATTTEEEETAGDAADQDDEEATLLPPSQEEAPRRATFSLPTLRTLSALLIASCTLVAWIWPSLTFVVSGSATVIVPTRQSYSLWGLATRVGTWGVVLLCTTVFVAPVLYALTYPRIPLLASWCAADVFVVACVAGLLQLSDFIGFILGDQMQDVFTAEAVLLPPLAGLVAAAAAVWALMLFRFQGHGMQKMHHHHIDVSDPLP